MTSYLLDTNVISELAPGRPTRDLRVVNWLEANSDALFLSVVTVAEVEAGIAFDPQRRQCQGCAPGGMAGSHRASVWFAHTRLRRANRESRGHDLRQSTKRGAVARLAGHHDTATAAHHGLTVLTRNLRHFQSLGVAVADPFVAGHEN